MNRAYNTLFDEWQAVEDMPPALYKQMNMAMVLLDQVLDEFKKAMVVTPTTPAPQKPAGGSADSAGGNPGYIVFPGGKN